MAKSRSKTEASRRLVVRIAGMLCLCHGAFVSAQPVDAVKAPDAVISGSERTLMFDLLPSERCNFGDLDAVLNDLRNGGDEMRLQLSVEAVGGATPKVFFGNPLEKKLSEKNMGTYRVAIPSPTEPTVYGVFLCTVKADALSKEPCSKQNLISFEEMSSPYRVSTVGLTGGKGEPYGGPQTVEPKVYFAQFLIGNATGFSTIGADTVQGGGAALESLGVSKTSADSAWPIMQKFSSTLGSLPLETAEERLQLVLPYFSDKKCNFSPGKK